MLPEGWKRVALGDIAQITSGGTPDRSEPRYWGGEIPWVTTGEIQFNTIMGTVEKITNDGLNSSSAKLFPAGTLLLAMYGQGKTRGQVAKLGIEAATNQNSAAILFDENQNSDFYFHYLASRYEDIREFGNSGGVSHLNAGLLKLIKVPTGPFCEQARMAEIFSAWNAAITVTENLLANSRRQKAALTHDLLLGRVRCAGYTKSVKRVMTRVGKLPEDWKHFSLGEVATEISMKNADDEVLPVLSCTKHHGLVDSLNYFNKRVFSENTSTYKIVPRAAFAYATNHIDEGSIGYQDLYDKALISPMYTVFQVTGQIDHGFLFRLLKTEHYRQLFAANTNASVDRRGSLRWNDFKRIEIPVPSLQEQLAIREVLDTADQEVKQLTSQLAALKQEKHALMADLLTGKRRVHLSEVTAEPKAA